MTTQENDLASPTDERDASSDTKASTDSAASNDSETPDEKPEPDDGAKEKAADMMAAYEDRPTLILPGSRGAVSGTAVGDWLDDDGNPTAMGDDDAPAAKLDSGEGKSSEGKSSEGKSSDDDEASDTDRAAAEAAEGIGTDEQIEKDKKFNKAIIEAKKRDKGASEEEQAKAERSEKSVTR